MEVNSRLGEAVVKVGILDAARPLWNYIEGNPAFRGYHLLVDFWHSNEHLSEAADALFGKESAEAKEWFEKWRFKLKYEEGDVEGLLRSIAYYRKKRSLPAARGKALGKQVGFFKRNKKRMNYHEHVANGWPIGSGPVEAACKTIVKARLCQSGMRWSREGGGRVLTLRVLKESNQWNSAWEHYQSEHWQPPEAAAA